MGVIYQGEGVIDENFYNAFLCTKRCPWATVWDSWAGIEGVPFIGVLLYARAGAEDCKKIILGVIHHKKN